MNRYLIFISLLLITSTSCEKEPPLYNRELLYGKWQMTFLEYQNRKLPEKKIRTQYIKFGEGDIFEFLEDGTGYNYAPSYSDNDTTPLTWNLISNVLTLDLFNYYGYDTSVSSRVYTILHLTENEFSLDLFRRAYIQTQNKSYYRSYKHISHYRKIE